MANAIVTATCSRCLAQKPSTDFNRNNARRCGLMAWCKRCVAEAKREAHKRDPERSRARDKDRRRKNLEKRKEIEHRAGATRRAKPGYHEGCNAKATERLRERHKALGKVFRCTVCAVEYCNVFGRQSQVAVCSDRCSRVKYLRGRVRKEKARRIRKRIGHAEFVDPWKIFDRDNWKCQLCGIKTPASLRGKNRPNSPELDHIVPLAVGGEHSATNTQCACRRCNRQKSDTPLGQLRLFG